MTVSEDRPLVNITTKDACVDFPIFDAKSRSLKKTVMGLVGGNIQLHPPNGGHPYTPGPLPAWVNLEP